MRDELKFLVKTKKTVRPFFDGLILLLKGVGLCFKNLKLFLLSFFPVLVSSILLFSNFNWLYAKFFNLLKDFLINESSYTFFGGSVLLTVFTFFIKFSSFLILIFLFYILLQILYIPFCSFISESILKKKGIINLNSLKEILTFNLKMFKVGLFKALVVSLVGFFLFLSSFLPVLALLPLYFGFLILSYDSFDYGLELYGLSFSERRAFFRRFFLMINGHALILFLLSFIPGVILLTLPFSVAGASLTLGEMYEQK